MTKIQFSGERFDLETSIWSVKELFHYILLSQSPGKHVTLLWGVCKCQKLTTQALLSVKHLGLAYYILLQGFPMHVNGFSTCFSNVHDNNKTVWTQKGNSEESVHAFLPYNKIPLVFHGKADWFAVNNYRIFNFAWTIPFILHSIWTTKHERTMRITSNVVSYPLTPLTPQDSGQATSYTHDTLQTESVENPFETDDDTKLSSCFWNSWICEAFGNTEPIISSWLVGGQRVWVAQI